MTTAGGQSQKGIPFVSLREKLPIVPPPSVIWDPGPGAELLKTSGGAGGTFSPDRMTPLGGRLSPPLWGTGPGPAQEPQLFPDS